ncbi:hypothetical protein CHS0354_037246, partial [Potamilus streckersoni]
MAVYHNPRIFELLRSKWKAVSYNPRYFRTTLVKLDGSFPQPTLFSNYSGRNGRQFLIKQ